MKENLCPICSGITKNRLVTESINYKGIIFDITGLMCVICCICGEEFYDKESTDYRFKCIKEICAKIDKGTYYDRL